MKRSPEGPDSTAELLKNTCNRQITDTSPLEKINYFTIISICSGFDGGTQTEMAADALAAISVFNFIY
jgi:hypothetical protein